MWKKKLYRPTIKRFEKLGGAQYKIFKQQYDRFFGKNPNENYLAAAKTWNSLTEGYWDILKNNIRKNADNSVQADKIIKNLSKKYVNGYFTRRVRQDFLDNLDTDASYFKKLVKENMTIAVKQELKGLKKGTAKYIKAKPIPKYIKARNILSIFPPYLPS